MAYILAIDIGMTNCKTVLYDERGRLLDRASVPYPTYHPRPGWVEQNPEEWWAAIREGLGQLWQRLPQVVASIDGISVTGHMHSLVCLDDDGAAAMPAIVLGDRRGMVEAGEITDELGLERICALTGTRMDVSMPAVKLRWLAAHAPEIHNRARAFVPCKDFIRRRLTGDLFTEPVDACGTSLYDLQRRAWSPELVRLARIRPGQLPEVVDPCQIGGALQAVAARELGLRPGIPVVVGAGDDVEVLGNGLIESGLSLEHLGTTGSILTCVDRPVYDPAMAVELYPHVIPGKWVIGGSVTSAGSALAWSQRVLRKGALDVALGEGLGESADPEVPLIFVPHLAGARCPAWEPRARGAWIGLSAEQTSVDLSRAVFQGVAFALKRVLARIEDLVGRQAQIRVCGSDPDQAGTELDGWRSFRASVYERPLAVIRASEPTALGATILAVVGLGIYSNVTDAVREITTIERLVEPDPGLSPGCERLYRAYCAAEDALRSLIQQAPGAVRRLSKRQGHRPEVLGALNAAEEDEYRR